MIILSFALLLFALFIKAEKRCDVLIKQKADLLKALFPFVIILGHVSFKYPDSIIKDMRFAGPYVVGVFFFLNVIMILMMDQQLWLWKAPYWKLG